MKNTKFILMMVGLILLIGTYALSSTRNQSDTIDKISILEKVEKANKIDISSNEKTFDFRLNDLNGMSYSLSDYKGKKVYLKYWASWCPICLAGMDEFDQLVKNNDATEQILILSVVSPGTFGEKSAVEFSKWYKERGYTIPVLLDDGGVIARKIGIRAFPTSVYIDANGTIIAVNPGQVSNDVIKQKIATLQ